MLHAISVGFACFILWLLLSGYFDVPLLLGFGILSSMLVAWLAWRVEVVDPEEYPLRLSIRPQIVLYWPWLFWQIVKANIDVTKLILNPKLPISPTMLSMKLPQRTDIARVIYANSITLTPGTVTTYLAGDIIDVHALTQEAAEALLDGEMGRRISALEMVD